MAQGLTNQIVNSVPGMRVVAIYNRRAPTRASHVYEYSRRLGRRSRPSTQAALDDAIRAGQPVGHRGRDAARALGADRRAGRHDRLGRVRRARDPRGVQARQGRRADERRDRRDHRPDPPGLRGEARRHPLRLRRRRARRADESLSLGQGPRPDAARDGQHQGTAGSLSQSDDAEGLRREVGPEPGDGHQLRRRLEDQLRAGDRRQRDRLRRASRAACRAASNTATT